ncbi:EamA family transporter [Leptolyngbya sp. BL0902]|nr:EamA family transporter [Leptolyngbya sp. BL0902]
MTSSSVSASPRATLIGFTAIGMWATLALLTQLSGPIPPFQLTAMAFTLAFGVGVLLWWREGESPWRYLKLPAAVWAVGLFGLFGYHFFYFLALRHAPAVEASLIAYLWPLLIVLMSAWLPGERLRWFHGAGAALGFLGAGLLITQGQGLSLRAEYTTGYLAALVCAFTWSGYSVLSRYFGAIPTQSVGGFCGVTAVLAWVCHGLTETSVLPVGWQWLAVFALGIGPVGLAFFTWDYGVKQGNLRTLGTLSYLAPLLSTLLLVLARQADPSWTLLLSSILIVGGALLASGTLRFISRDA